MLVGSADTRHCLVRHSDACPMGQQARASPRYSNTGRVAATTAGDHTPLRDPSVTVVASDPNVTVTPPLRVAYVRAGQSVNVAKGKSPRRKSSSRVLLENDATIAQLTASTDTSSGSRGQPLNVSTDFSTSSVTCLSGTTFKIGHRSSLHSPTHSSGCRRGRRCPVGAAAWRRAIVLAPSAGGAPLPHPWGDRLA